MNHNSLRLPNPDLTDLLKNLSLAFLVSDSQTKTLTKELPLKSVLKKVNTSLERLKVLLPEGLERHRLTRGETSLLAAFQATQDALQQLRHREAVRLDLEISLQLDDIKYAIEDLKIIIQEHPLPHFQTKINESIGEPRQAEEDDEESRIEARNLRQWEERQLDAWDEE